jgi:hypothetical protein
MDRLTGVVRIALLHPASLSVLGYYRGMGAVERWNSRVAA